MSERPANVENVVESVDRILERIETSTRGLIRAAEVDNGEAIEREVVGREEAIRMLNHAAAARGQSVAELIGRERFRGLMAAADEAETALRQLQERVGEQFRALVQGSRAVRGYAGYSREPSSLDRAG